MADTMVVFQRWTYGPPARETVRDFAWEAVVEDLGAGAGRIPCPSGCRGPASHHERIAARTQPSGAFCIECKDTGTVLVSL